MLSEIDRFVNWIRRRSPDARTWKDYGYDLHLFVQMVGNRPIHEISVQDIDQFITHQSEQGFKPTTINRRLAAITALYAFLAPDDESLVCPVLPRRHHLREPQRLPRPVQEEDLQQFFLAIDDPRDRAMFTLMLRCGLRIAEVAEIQLSDLYLEEDFPRLLVRGKGSRQRSVYLSFQAQYTLREYLLLRPAAQSEYLFLSYQLDGLSTTAIHKRMMHYRDLAGLHITCHQLRHSFANDLLNADVPVTSIQKLMGHRWIDTTQVYVQANDRQVKQDYFTASQKIEEWQPYPGNPTTQRGL